MLDTLCAATDHYIIDSFAALLFLSPVSSALTLSRTHKPAVYKKVLMRLILAMVPLHCSPNIWPTQHLPQLEPAFKELGQLIVDVGLLITVRCDRYSILSISCIYPWQHS